MHRIDWYLYLLIRPIKKHWYLQLITALLLGILLSVGFDDIKDNSKPTVLSRIIEMLK